MLGNYQKGRLCSLNDCLVCYAMKHELYFKIREVTDRFEQTKDRIENVPQESELMK